MGSYFQCVDLEPNLYIGQPQYCTFKFQPIIPKRPRYHNILAAIENLANFTTKDDVSKLPGSSSNLALDLLEREEEQSLITFSLHRNLIVIVVVVG